jgi:hypothetical protein
LPYRMRKTPRLTSRRIASPSRECFSCLNFVVVVRTRPLHQQHIHASTTYSRHLCVCGLSSAEPVAERNTSRT